MKNIVVSKKIIKNSIRNYYNNFDEKSKEGTIMYPYISHQKGGGFNIEGSNSNLFRLIKSNHIPFQYKQCISEDDIKKSFRRLIRWKKFKCVKKDGMLHKYVPRITFLFPFWTSTRITFTISITALVVSILAIIF